jgi:hypothetical protein
MLEKRGSNEGIAIVHTAHSHFHTDCNSNFFYASWHVVTIQNISDTAHYKEPLLREPSVPNVASKILSVGRVLTFTHTAAFLTQ